MTGPAQLVYERQYFGQDQGETKIGFRIDDRIWWVGYLGPMPTDKQRDQYKKDLDFCDDLVRYYNCGVASDIEKNRLDFCEKMDL
jgi:hypothetical protein